MSKPRISFIIPYFDKLRSIGKCLKSLFSQSIKDIEVIVVMDGPDPEARRVLLMNKKIKVIEIPHGGACRARNEGFKHATADIVVFWDADCYVEHGAAQVWLQLFDSKPDIDFVYSGYRFQEGMGAIPGEPFDPWLLQVNNYISACFPIRKAKAPKWDESLKSLQDWDFWLTTVENGCKGQYIRGYAFQTDFPDKRSISGVGCSSENWLDRLETVKNKHGIPLRDICVSAIPCKDEGIRLAKIMDADYRDCPTHFPNRYKTIVQLGFDPHIANEHARNFVNPHSKEPLNNILFWRAQDVYSLRYEVAQVATENLAIAINGAVKFQFCEDQNTKKSLQKLGFKVVVLPLPINVPDEKLSALPEKFKILADVDPNYNQVFNSIQRACPDIAFVPWTGSINADEYSMLLRFHPNRCLDQGVKKMLLNGRRVISNIQSPYCGFVPFEEDMGAARAEIIRALRKIQVEKRPDEMAAKYYRDICSPEKFIEILKTVGAIGAREVAYA